MPKTTQEYSLAEFYAAVWVEINGHPLLRVDRITDRIVSFIFADTPEFREALDAFNGADLTGNIHHFIDGIRRMKSQMYRVVDPH